MAQAKGIAIDVAMNTDKLQRKLRAIAKHTEALADELDAIDNAWTCKCGSIDYQETKLCEVGTNKVVLHERECNECHEHHSMIDNELPTRFEGSE